MSQKTWMPLYIGDYLADTQHLSTEEHGAYFLLIMHYWRNGGAIKNDKNLLKNITKVSTKKLENILAFFEEKNGLLFHKRIDEELAEAKENSEKSTAKAKAAAEKRWGKQCLGDATSIPPSNAPSTPQALLEQCPSPSPSPSKKENQSSSSELEAVREDDDENFSEKISESSPNPKPPESAENPKPLWHQTYHQTEAHPKFNEVWEYITTRLPNLKKQGATEINRWLHEGVDPPEIYQNVDFCISASREPIRSFSYFSPSISTAATLKKELAEQEERMRKKYAKSE